jgi:protein-S-isoprenylcysteine O-methyltransferase Ste14
MTHVKSVLAGFAVGVALAVLGVLGVVASQYWVMRQQISSTGAGGASWSFVTPWIGFVPMCVCSLLIWIISSACFYMKFRRLDASPR